MTDPAMWDVATLSAAFGSGSLSPVEVLSAVRARIAAPPAVPGLRCGKSRFAIKGCCRRCVVAHQGVDRRLEGGDPGPNRRQDLDRRQ